MSEYKIKTINGRKIPEHRAVIEELLDVKLDKNQVVHHINGNKKDNRPENLEVMDWREHSRLHASRMVQTPEKLRKVSEARKGKPNPTARQLKDEQVEAIVRALSGGVSVTALAAEYGVSDHVIRNIRDGKTYRDVLEKLPEDLFPLPQAKSRRGSSGRKLGILEVTDIRLRLRDDQSIASIAKLYYTTQETIRRIRDGETYQDIPQPQIEAEYRIVTDLQELADIMLEGPMPDKNDGLDPIKDDNEVLFGEKVSRILKDTYGIWPNRHARLAYMLMRKAMNGDRTALFAIFSMSSYDSLVDRTFDSASQISVLY
jgi:hypothetical protein